MGSTTRRCVLRLLAAAVSAASVAGCGGGATGLPPDAPGVEPAEADAFTETVRAADGQARKAVAEQLASRFGRDLRVLPRRIDSDAEPGAIKAHYETALVAGRGWTEFPLADYGSTWSFAFMSPDARSILAVVVLNPRFAPEGGGDVPLTILTNLPETGSR